MSHIHARDFIGQEIPLPLQALLPNAVRTAYETVDKLRKAHNFLTVDSAVVGRGHLLAWAVDYEIFKLIRDGHWPFDCEWKPFHRPTGVYLRIDTGNAFLTVNQLPEIGEGPRYAKFRTNAALSNHPFLPFDTFEREAAQADRKHLVVGHGYQQLDFIVIGAPHPEQPRVWIDRTDNILRRKHSNQALSDEVPDHQGSAERAPVEGADIEIDLELVEHLQKQVRDEHG